LSERLRRLRNEGRAILLVTHDLLRASEIGDAALILLSGRILHRAVGRALERSALEAAYAEVLAAEVPAP
jgi:ABC-type Mn2+/Zn2+ transport system ATPase subunit